MSYFLCGLVVSDGVDGEEVVVVDDDAEVSSDDDVKLGVAIASATADCHNSVGEFRRIARLEEWGVCIVTAEDPQLGHAAADLWRRSPGEKDFTDSRTPAIRYATNRAWRMLGPFHMMSEDCVKFKSLL